MSFFSYNYYKTLKRPLVYISTPSKHIIGTIQTKELQTDFMANSMNKGTFKVNRYENGISTPFYDWINTKMYVYIHGIDWFVIKECHIVNEEINEYKEITYISLEYELSKKILTSFGSLGLETDEQGGLDRYCLYNSLDRTHSILHIIVDKSPDWTINYVDPGITQEYRNFQVDSIDIYSFLTQNVSQAFDCIFTFDSTKKTISAYLLENLGHNTGITLSYRNFIKSADQSSDDDDVKTVLTVVGGNDSRTNTPLGIIDVNISGTNQIYNFSYYLYMMTQELQSGLSAYDKRCKQNESAYQQTLSRLGNLYLDLNNLKSKSPTSSNSTNWSEYGLIELQTQEKIYKTNMSLYTDQSDANLFKTNSTIHQAIENEISVRKGQIANKESEIKNCKIQAESLIVKLDEFLGRNLYSELSAYVREDTLTDDSFVATTTMTDKEILEMQKELLKHASKELEKVCHPKFETTIDLINFTVNYDYNKFTDQLELFNIIHIRFDEHDVVSDARLLKLHVNWDDPSDFSAAFSNRNSLDEAFSLLKEIQDQAESTATQIGFASGAWKDAAQSSKEFKEYQDAVFDASLKEIQSSDNQETLIDETGIMLRRWIPEQTKYDPCQMWLVNNQLAMTVDGWNSVSLAIGHIKVGNDYFYGVNAKHLLGQITITEQLYISNASGNYSITKDGFLAKNGSYQVKINPNTPGDIFSISIDNNKLLYVDANSKKLVFGGRLEVVEGKIASYTISGNALTSGNIGMSSDNTAGAKSFWAGNSDPNKAHFWVDNQGKVYCDNIEIAGGHLKVGQNFEVFPDGTMNAANGNFSGTITGTTINGGTINGTTINGGTDIRFHARKGYVSIGDFEVNDDYGRHIFQSSDGVTGMSTGDAEEGELYLWAGYGRSRHGDGILLVNVERQVWVNGDLWINRDGENINVLDAIKGSSGCSEDECDDTCNDDWGGGCDCDGDGCAYGPGYT